MDNYIEQVLVRLENVISGHHVISPRTLVPGEVVGVGIMVARYQGQETGVCVSKLDAFMAGLDASVRQEIQLGIGMTLLRIKEIRNKQVVAEAIIDEDLWKVHMGDEPIPTPPTFHTLKYHDTLRYDYDQMQNFLWACNGMFITGKDDLPFHVDLDYFIYVLLVKAQNFNDIIIPVISFLMHHLKKDDEWGKGVHARLMRLRYKTLFTGNNLNEEPLTLH